MTISQISSGTLIDQKVLSDLINKVNEIDNNQYNSISSIANGLTSGQQKLQNGQWAVSTQFLRPGIVIKTDTTNVNGPFQGTFDVSFDPLPLVTGTVYSQQASAGIQNVLCSILITEITSDGFKYKVITAASGVKEKPEQVSIMFTAIGKIKKEA